VAQFQLLYVSDRLNIVTKTKRNAKYSTLYTIYLTL